MTAPLDPSAVPAPPRVVLLGSQHLPRVGEEMERLRPMIDQFARVVGVDLTGEADLADWDAELAVVFGGDGSILRAARQMGYRQFPVIGINLGKLGFLAELSPDEFVAALPLIGRHEFRIVEHLMFECQVIRRGQVIEQQLGLNETAILAGPPFAMLQVDLYVDSELVTTYSCDGLLVSTPVGSTAHCLSAGGPILRKNLPAFVILPISPHTLTNRPVVDTAEHVYEMVVPRPNAGSAVVVDGQVLCGVEPGDRVQVRRAEPRFQLVELAGRGYYRTLREKLGWGGGLNRHA